MNKIMCVTILAVLVGCKMPANTTVSETNDLMTNDTEIVTQNNSIPFPVNMEEKDIYSQQYQECNHLLTEKAQLGVIQTYNAGYFNPIPGQPNRDTFDRIKTVEYLSHLVEKHSIGDIIAVDGLKYQLRGHPAWPKDEYCFEPYPIKPLPVQKNDIEYFREYAQWIEDNPNFGYPPLPPLAEHPIVVGNPFRQE